MLKGGLPAIIAASLGGSSHAQDWALWSAITRDRHEKAPPDGRGWTSPVGELRKVS